MRRGYLACHFTRLMYLKFCGFYQEGSGLGAGDLGGGGRGEE